MATKKKEYKPIDQYNAYNSPPPWFQDWKKDNVEYVLDRLRYLHSLKSHRFPKYWQFREEYGQYKEIDNTEDGFIKYTMNTWFAIVNAKVAEIFASTPQYDFVWLDETGRKYKKLVEKLWDWVWQDSWTNKALTTIIRDACKYWTGFWLEKYVKRKRKIKIPTIPSVDAKLIFEDKEILEYEWCELEPLDWSSVYVNGSSIETATEAIIIKHWDKDEFFSAFPSGWFYTYNKDSIVPWKNYFTKLWESSLVVTTATDRTNAKDSSNTISTIEYWNKYKDEYIVIANDIHINPYWADGIMPLPHPHKEIPIVCYTDHYVDGDIYWRGEFDITSNSRKLKDESRSLMIETVKIQGGIITIDPSSDFDETVERIWLKQFARVAKEDFWFFSPSVNISPLELLEKKIDEDIIIETWVDFRWQLFWPNETAERTKWRIESARKRINSNIRENAYSFYERMARLRIENIKTYYKGRSDMIPVKWFSISKDGVQDALSWDYGVMEITSNMLTWKILLIPIVDSITWDTSKIQKQKYMEFLQLALNMKKQDGSPLFDPALLIDAGRWIIDDAVDLDKLLWWNAWVDSEVEKALKERWLPLTWDSQQNAWGGIPPSQMSWRPILLPSQSPELTSQQ